MTCEELLESWPIKKLFDKLHIYHWYTIKESRKLYPNAPETLLPKWCKRGIRPFFGVDVNEHLARVPGDKMSDRTRQWITKRYAKWWISDDYRTSGVNLCNKINPAQVIRSSHRVLLHNDQLLPSKT